MSSQELEKPTFSAILFHPTLIGCGLALAFAALCLAILSPRDWRKRWFWMALVAGALLFAPGACWVQLPLEKFVWWGLFLNLPGQVVARWLRFFSLPQSLAAAFVQEGIKLLPVLAILGWEGAISERKKALAVGIASGVGFGLVEAQWRLNLALPAEELLKALRVGLSAFSGLALQGTLTGLAGYGLARPHGWLGYVGASSLHFLANCGSDAAVQGFLPWFLAESWLVLWALLTVAIALLVRGKVRRPPVRA